MSEQMQTPLGTGSLNDPEPAPKPGGIPVWPAVIADLQTALLKGGIRGNNSRTDTIILALINDMHERDFQGFSKYGTPLKTNNGRDALRDAYQENLDLIVYLKQKILEGDGELMPVYRDAISMATTLRTLAHVRFGK